jgi:hypothetical protein
MYMAWMPGTGGPGGALMARSLALPPRRPIGGRSSASRSGVHTAGCIAASGWPRQPVGRRSASLPARFLWPGDVLVHSTGHRELSRVEYDGAEVRVYAGGGALALAPDQVVQALVPRR